MKKNMLFLSLGLLFAGANITAVEETQTSFQKVTKLIAPTAATCLALVGTAGFGASLYELAKNPTKDNVGTLLIMMVLAERGLNACGLELTKYSDSQTK